MMGGRWDDRTEDRLGRREDEERMRIGEKKRRRRIEEGIE
jgi:hypothetical protein